MKRFSGIPARILAAGALCMFARHAAAQARDEVAPTLSRARTAFSVVLPVTGDAAVPGGRNGASSGAADSIPTFTGEFQALGIGPSGKADRNWLYQIVGTKPEFGGTTLLDAPIVPVSLDLLDYDGTVRVVDGHRLHSSALPFARAVMDSPMFQNADYSSSDSPTQFADAVLRAEFYSRMQSDWHTLLRPSIRSERTLAIPRGSYFFALKNNGECCAFILVDNATIFRLLFPSNPLDLRSPVRAAERAGDITTRSLSTFLLPNTYLYTGGSPNQCCVLGLHTYDSLAGNAENGFREKRYVLNVSSWITPGLFGASLSDITAISHELTESLHDPFVGSDGLHGITPWWLSVNGNCQNDFEVGDAIEGLPDSTVAITTRGHTYHPQNIALLQWFAFQSPSTALGGAYSYPNQTVLTSLSPPQNASCR